MSFLPVLLVAVGADVWVQRLQVDSGHVGSAPHRHWEVRRGRGGKGGGSSD